MRRPIQALKAHVASSRQLVGHCEWFRPIRLGLALLNGIEALDDAQRELLRNLKAAFLQAGHTVQSQPSRDSDLILSFYTIPPGTEPLRERVVEVHPPLAVAVRDHYDLDGLHPNLVVVVTVTEDLHGLSHVEMEDLARLAMARIGAFKVLFIKAHRVSRATEYYVFTTIEGGHPTIFRSIPHCFEELRDRLVTHACAREAGGYKPVKDAIPYEDWQNCCTVDYIVRAGRRLGELGHLDAPIDVGRWVSPERTQLIRFLLGWQRQAAGAMIAIAPDLQVPDRYRSNQFTGACIVTCTGREEVDKTNLRRDDDLVAVALHHGVLHAFAVEGRTLKRPSIEADELVGGMLASPPVRLSRHAEGYVFDPNGDIVVPRIWAIVHTHRGVEELRAVDLNGQEVQVVAHILPNVQDFPYAVGCGKDIMFDISRDAMAKAVATANLDSPTVVGIFDVPNHGTNFFIYCASRPGTKIIPRNPFENLLNLLDPDVYGAIKLTTEVPQI
ncbi:MAG: hypothetical protein WBH57_02175 [Anaerolineae bacterium]